MNKKIKKDGSDFLRFDASRRGEKLVLKPRIDISTEIAISEVLASIFSRTPKLLEFAQKNLSVNGARRDFRNCSITKNDVIEIENLYKPSKNLIPPAADIHTKLQIAYEDDFIIILDKPAGIKIHADSEGDTDALSNILQSHFINTNRPFLEARHVHRLDINTSGLIIYAKDHLSLSLLDNMMANDQIHRKYLAKIQGKPSKSEAVLNYPIGRDRHIANKYRVSATGKPAITYYKIISYDLKRRQSVAEVSLKTGRTHQIRVHFSHIGHPIVGDSLYGSSVEFKSGAFLLHSCYVSFTHPYTKKSVEIFSTPGFFKFYKHI